MGGGGKGVRGTEGRETTVCVERVRRLTVATEGIRVNPSRGVRAVGGLTCITLIHHICPKWSLRFPWLRSLNAKMIACSHEQKHWLRDGRASSGPAIMRVVRRVVRRGGGIRQRRRPELCRGELDVFERESDDRQREARVSRLGSRRSTFICLHITLRRALLSWPTRNFIAWSKFFGSPKSKALRGNGIVAMACQSRMCTVSNARIRESCVVRDGAHPFARRLHTSPTSAMNTSDVHHACARQLRLPANKPIF